MKKSISISILFLTAFLLFGERNARAQTCGNSPCETITPQNSGIGLEVNGNSTNTGIYVSNANLGLSVHNGLIAGSASTGPALQVYTTDNNGSAAIIATAYDFANGVQGIAASANATGVYATNTGGGYAMYSNGRMNVQGCFSVDGVGEFGCSSDERLKKNIAPLAGSLDRLLALRGVTYEWNDPNKKGKQTGFIAQDVAKSFPAWVNEGPDGFKTLTLPSYELTALEVESIRALKADNDELRMRVKSLEVHRSSGWGTAEGWGTAGISLGLLGMVGVAFAVRKRS